MREGFHTVEYFSVYVEQESSGQPFKEIHTNDEKFEPMLLRPLAKISSKNVHKRPI